MLVQFSSTEQGSLNRERRKRLWSSIRPSIRQPLFMHSIQSAKEGRPLRKQAGRERQTHLAVNRGAESTGRTGGKRVGRGEERKTHPTLAGFIWITVRGSLGFFAFILGDEKHQLDIRCWVFFELALSFSYMHQCRMLQVFVCLDHNEERLHLKDPHRSSCIAIYRDT